MDWKLCILCQTKTREALQNQRSENMSELQPVINWPKNASSALSKLDLRYLRNYSLKTHSVI